MLGLEEMTLKRAEKLVFLLCLILLPTQLGRHFWPQSSFIYSLPVDYLSPTIYLWDLLSLLLFGIFLLNKPKINFRALNIFLIFLVSLVPSLLIAQNMGASFEMLWRYLTVGLFGIYLASSGFQKLEKELFYGLSVAVISQSLIALGEFFSGGSLNLWVLGERNFDITTPSIATFNYIGRVFLRPYATFPHPNVLAAFMVITLPIIGYSPLLNKQLKKITIMLGGIVVLLTFSRGAILVGLGDVLIFFRRKWRLLIIPLLILLPILWIRYNSVFNFDSLSITRREDLNHIALVDFMHSPILGVGLNNFINQTASSDLISGPTRFLQPAHNIFLLSLAETGLIGFIGFMILILIPILSHLKSKQEKFSQLILLLWGSILLLGMVDHYFLTLPQGQRLLFLVWGLSL